ncbi:cytochrome c oxidase assembly factor 3 homolog, mitochondrial [Erpetoichthys calabaricus]|uniref:cytochrome c oxidase assembly factor 3 homolog, mitochondrial n=1 Tax=Erpetoichthys calabaricus TaxID=27687 RepID=UPI0010A05637|nr:cytochrome c oxidase assembly factor 3 homolog, mitochondrial [Erpetoichthys calabaricus]
MSQKRPPEDSKAPLAQRIDPKKEPLNQEQASYIRRAEFAQWQNKFKKMRARNIVTGLSIGAVVIGIYGYTFYSISQEKFLDDLESEAKLARTRTSAN